MALRSWLPALVCGAIAASSWAGCDALTGLNDYQVEPGGMGSSSSSAGGAGSGGGTGAAGGGCGIGGTITPEGDCDDNGNCTFSCATCDRCSGIVCPAGKDCTVICDGMHSCEEPPDCNGATNCSLRCDDGACTEAVLADADYCSIACLGGSCSVTECESSCGECSIQCKDGSCSGRASCFANNYCTVDCDDACPLEVEAFAGGTNSIDCKGTYGLACATVDCTGTCDVECTGDACADVDCSAACTCVTSCNVLDGVREQPCDMVSCHGGGIACLNDDGNCTLDAGGCGACE